MTFTPRELWLSTYEQVEWVLDHLHMMQEGQWPDGLPKDESNVHTGDKRAPFETACLAAGEVELRVKRCGTDGMLAEEKYNRGLTEQAIAKARHLPFDQVYYAIRRVINYCASGANRRRNEDGSPQSYEEWKKINRNRRGVVRK